MEDIEEYIYDDDGNPVLQRPTASDTEDDRWADEADQKDIFHMKTEGYDVTLSLARGLITWTNVNPSSGKKKGIFKGKNKLDQQTIMLRDLFGVKMKRRKTTNPDEDGICLGFTLHVCDIYAPNTLAERVLFFEHPSEALCAMYVRKMQMYISELANRPKYVKLLLQTYAGNKNGKSLYKNKVLPLFQTADINVDLVEIEHNEHVKQEMVHVNLHDYDCIIAMGGDGTVNKVTDCLLTHCQKDKDIEEKPGFTPTKSTLPLGIIPIGSTDHIARSVMGTDDIQSACLYIIMGRTMGVDVCSMYKDDKFQQWCFNAHYGFAGNILDFRKRYRSVGKRGLEPAFVKAITKSKLRSYKCDIEYIPAMPPLPVNRKFIPCYRGCDVCWEEKVTDGDEVTSDLVQPFNPLAESQNSDTLVDLAAHEDSPWHTVKGDYLSVSLLGNAGRSDIAPRGLSKYGHLNDGVMEMILVKATERKEFIRFLKRLGNTKNQFDFPFVEVIRVKEVRFRLCLPIGFHYNDYNYSEIDYEMSRREKQNKISAKNSTEILELDDCSDEDFESTPIQTSQTPPVQSKIKHKPPMKRANTVQGIQVESKNGKDLRRTTTETSIDVGDSDDSDLDEDDDDSEDDDNQSAGSGDIVTTSYNGVKTVRSMSAPPQKLVGPQYRMTFAEKDRAKRRKRAQKKEEKKRLKEQGKMKSFWNVDNEIRDDEVLDFRIHHGLLRLYGQGVSPESIFHDSTLLCIPRL